MGEPIIKTEFSTGLVRIVYEFNYPDFVVGSLPKSCSHCPVGFMDHNCGRRVPLDWEGRPPECKLRTLEDYLREQPVTNRNGLNCIESEAIKVVEIDQVTRNSHDVATNLQPEASNQQVTEPLQRNGFSGSEEAPASKNQVKGIRLMARPWRPQDLLDDLQLMIDDEPDRYLNDRRTTPCMARDFLKEHFAESGWISVEDRLPPEGERVLTTDGAFVGEMYINKRGQWQRYNVNDYSLLMALDILWWMPLPEPPEVDT